MRTILAVLKQLYNRRRVMALAVVVLIGIVAGVGAGQSGTLTPGQLFDAMREPAVRIRVDYIVWQAQIKPEYQIEMVYSASLRGIHQLMQLDGGQSELFVPWDRDEYLLPPEVWVQDGTIYCKAAPVSQPGIAGNLDEFKFDRGCDNVFSVTLPGKTHDILDRAQYDAVTRIPNGYVFKVEPQTDSTIVDVELGILPKLLSPMYFSLDKLNRYDPNDKSRVTELVASRSAFGTGLILPDAKWKALEYIERGSQGLRQTSYFARQYEDMTFIATNQHVIAPVLDTNIYIKYDETGKAIWYAEAVTDAKAYVQLNTNSTWIPININGFDADLDLALVSTNRPLPYVPEYAFVGTDYVPAGGDTVYVAGHPMGRADDIVTEGVLQRKDHVPAPGTPRWGRERFLVNVDAMGGNSGSPSWVIRNGTPQMMGILHAGYGTRLEVAGLELHGDPFSGELMAFAPTGEFKLDGPLNIEPESSGFAPAPYQILITIDDIADFIFSQGLDIPALTERFDYLN